jgi:serine/threonine-protein kinase
LTKRVERRQADSMPQVDAEFLALQEALAGRYSLETELGRGGMGIVYLALDVRLDRPVALKVLPEHLAKDEGLRARFMREARTAAKLSHPNIVPIHSVDEVGQYVFFAMAYVAGETLGEHIRGHGPLSPSECMRVVREVGFALSYAHAQGVVHRDVKPDNILLEEGTLRAMVADFGIAAIVDDTTSLGEGEIIGTVEFMSPEQATGERIDARSDLYSLGMVAYYALTGTLPFESTDLASTLQSVRHAPVPSVAQVATAAPRRFARIIDGCLKKDPTERFASAEALTEALDAATAARKQVPVAVRTFLYDPVDLGGDAPLYFSIASLASLPMVAAVVQVPELWPMLAGYWGVALGIPTMLVPPRVRRLLGSGNTIVDLELGLQQDLEQRREEAPLPKNTSLTRLRSLLRKVSLTGLGGSWLLFCGALFGIPMTDQYEFILTFTGLASLAGFFLSVSQGEELRALKKAERRLKFWKGKIGRVIVAVSGVGLRTRITDVRATHRPTELQIGLAAEALFEALPKDMRKKVGDVPALLRQLEADASRLRNSVTLLAEAESLTLPNGVQLPEDLRATRDQAERQLADVVAALEGIRLSLLRLTAGTGTVEGLTTNVLAAGEIGDNVARLLAGFAEVEEVLKRETGP